MNSHAVDSGTAGRSDWLVVARAEPGYAEAVVKDMSRIAKTASGRAVLERIRASGHSVQIQKPDAVDPPNAWVRPHDPDASRPAMARSGHGSDCIVAYDPRQWPNPAHPSVGSSDVLLFTMLREALDHLLGTADVSRREAGPAVVPDDEVVAGYQRERDNG
jgi:hypothetical protein